tara:strand:+ start:534 stop:869 length:336 start_codon:yes stop_codon:yes gene_type:complete
MPLDIKTTKKAVQKGTAMLDKHFPFWHTKFIDIELPPSNHVWARTIIGIVTNNDYYTEIRKIENRLGFEAFDCGFYSYEEYTDIRELWLLEINMRLNKEDALSVIVDSCEE